MVKIQIYNVVSHVWGTTPYIDSLLDATLSYRSKGYFFAPAYKSGKWDGFNHLYYAPTPSRQYGKYWTGLFHRVKTLFEANNIDFEAEDCRTPPDPQKQLSTVCLGRKYQELAESAAVNKTRGIIQIPTAGGKTPVAAAIMAHLNQPSIFLVHRVNLLNQTVKLFEKTLKMPIGVLQGSNRRLERFNVGMVQTLYSVLWSASNEDLKKWVYEDCKLLITDECHHSGSDMWKNVIQQFMGSYYRFGLSATPHKNEVADGTQDMQIEGLFGRIIYTIPTQDLTEQGHLAKAHVFYV